MLVKSRQYTILIVILSVLLAISLIVGSTFAWFTSSETASRTIVLGDPVILHIVDTEGEPINGDSGRFPIIISGANLLPGMQIKMLARAVLKQGNTPALLRARVGINIYSPSGQEAISPVTISQVLNDLNNGAHGIMNAVDSNKWWHHEGWWYYLGSEGTIINGNHVLERIDMTEGDTFITFIDSADSFNFPLYVDNSFANAQVQFTLEFQAIQGYLPAFDDDLTGDGNEVLDGNIKSGFRWNTIPNILEIFEEFEMQEGG